MKRILAMFAFLIAFIAMASVEQKSAREEIRQQVMNLDQEVYEYILLQIDADHITDEMIWEYYNNHRKTCESIEYENLKEHL